MAYERKDGDMALFQNKTSSPENKRPTMTGELLLGGVTYEVSMWTKLDRNGDKFLAGRVKEKESRAAPASKPEPVKGFDDSIPF